MRLNKYISQSGYCSRRKADQLIESGKVLVNGKTVRELGTVIDPIKDKVKVEGKKIAIPMSKTYIALYKPKGVLSTMSSDPRSLQNFTQAMGISGLFHVGRLDQESEGLLLLTNDGDWAHRIAHPSFRIQKEYEVEINRELASQEWLRLTNGVDLEDGLFKADSATKRTERSLRLVIHDGRNRIIRRVFESFGCEVLRLKRLSIGRVELGRMRPGQWKEIDHSSI